MNPASLDVAVSRRAITILAIGACVGAASVLAARPAVDVSVAWGGAVALLPAVAAAVFDIRFGRLPDALVAATAFVPVLIVLVGGGEPSGIVTIAAGSLAMAGPLCLLHLAAPASVGFGDVKLAAALGMLVGLADVGLATWALAIASGTTLLLALARRSRVVPFGPGLVSGTAAVLVGRLLGLEIPR